MSTRRSALIGRSMLISAQKTRPTAEGGSKKGYYKPLPKEFRRGGFTYKQIARESDVAIYQQTWNGCQNPSVSYEIIRIRRREGFQIGQKLIQPYEIYPNSDSWGVDGFTVTDREAAFHKLREIAASLNAPARVGQKRKRRRLEKSPT
jgi:hypothetical protein